MPVSSHIVIKRSASNPVTPPFMSLSTQPRRGSRLLLVVGIFWLCSQSEAQQTSGFPRAAVNFLDDELPRMEGAVATRDAAYFKAATERSWQLLEKWGLKTNPVELDRHPSCVDAITDYLIVGLCKLAEPGKICEPATFFPKFEKELAACRSEVQP